MLIDFLSLIYKVFSEILLHDHANRMTRSNKDIRVLEITERYADIVTLSSYVQIMISEQERKIAILYSADQSTMTVGM